MHQTTERQQCAQFGANAAQGHRTDNPALGHRLALARRCALNIDPADLRFFDGDLLRRIDQAQVIDLPSAAAVKRCQSVDAP